MVTSVGYADSAIGVCRWELIRSIDQPNVLLDANLTVLLADFGLSGMVDIAPSWTDKTGIGKAAWVAPELLGLKPNQVRSTYESDMYSFGCLCVEVSTLVFICWPTNTLI